MRYETKIQSSVVNILFKWSKESLCATLVHFSRIGRLWLNLFSLPPLSQDLIHSLSFHIVCLALFYKRHQYNTLCIFPQHRQSMHLQYILLPKQKSLVPPTGVSAKKHTCQKGFFHHLDNQYYVLTQLRNFLRVLPCCFLSELGNHIFIEKYNSFLVHIFLIYIYSTLIFKLQFFSGKDP